MNNFHPTLPCSNMDFVKRTISKMAVKMRGDCQFALVTTLSYLLSDFSKILHMDYFNDDHQNDRHLSVRNYAYSHIVTYHLIPR